MLLLHSFLTRRFAPGSPQRKIKDIEREVEEREYEKRKYLSEVEKVKEENDRMERKIRDVERDVNKSASENKRLKEELRSAQEVKVDNERMERRIREVERDVNQSASENQRLKEELRSTQMNVDQSISENRRLKEELRSSQVSSSASASTSIYSSQAVVDSNQISLLKSGKALKLLTLSQYFPNTSFCSSAEIDALKNQVSTPTQPPRTNVTASRTPMSLAGARILKRVRTNTVNAVKMASPPPQKQAPSPIPSIPKTPYTPLSRSNNLSASAIQFEDETVNTFDYGSVYVEQLKHLQEELDKERGRGERMEKENREIKDEDEKLQTRLDESLMNVSTLTSTLNQSHAQTTSLTTSLSEAKSRIFQLQTAVSEKVAAVRLLERAREEAEGKTARLTQENAELLADKKELGEKIDELRKKVRADSARIERLSETELKLDRESKECAKFRDQLKTLEEQVRNSDATLKHYNFTSLILTRRFTRRSSKP